jgi:hypothetical protein
VDSSSRPTISISELTHWLKIPKPLIQRAIDWRDANTWESKKMNNVRILYKTVLIVTSLSVGLASQVQAQRVGPLSGGSPAGSYSRELLKRLDVQTELGLDTHQKGALAKFFSKSYVEVPLVSMFRDISRLSDEERKQWRAEVHRQAAEVAAKIMKENRRQMEEILRPDQRKRLIELDLQWRGILALGDRNLSESLEVSPAHHQRIAKIVAEFEVKRVSLHSETDSLRYQKLLQETEPKVFAILSDEEKGRWAQAIGRPFLFGN